MRFIWTLAILSALILDESLVGSKAVEKNRGMSTSSGSSMSSRRSSSAPSRGSSSLASSNQRGAKPTTSSMVKNHSPRPSNKYSNKPTKPPRKTTSTFSSNKQQKFGNNQGTSSRRQQQTTRHSQSVQSKRKNEISRANGRSERRITKKKPVTSTAARMGSQKKQSRSGVRAALENVKKSKTVKTERGVKSPTFSKKISQRTNRRPEKRFDRISQTKDRLGKYIARKSEKTRSWKLEKIKSTPKSQSSANKRMRPANVMTKPSSSLNKKTDAKPDLSPLKNAGPTRGARGQPMPKTSTKTSRPEINRGSKKTSHPLFGNTRSSGKALVRRTAQWLKTKIGGKNTANKQGNNPTSKAGFVDKVKTGKSKIGQMAGRKQNAAKASCFMRR